MQNKRVELLAPAGNAEGFYGAVHAGADAVYLGGSRFGARAYADNFTTEELTACIRYAHIWGRKVYLTVNTLARESEFGDISEYLTPFYRVGLDGVIVQDIGVFSYIRDHFPGLELHVSTQMTLTGEYGARLLQKMGACRIVPARELSLEEIRHIKQETGLEIETFVHGAMCYCYSGQCLFSSILGGRSGNRGRCAQPCRLPYQVTTPYGTSDICYPLSLKDMCTIERIPELIEAGIDSFKIEGRMKKPEYAAGVTAIYRKYIDRYYAGNKKMDAEDLRKLSHLYIRSERQDGYYYKQHGRDMVALDNPAYSGSDEELLNEIREKYLQTKPKLPVSVYADFTVGRKAALTLLQQDFNVTVYGETVIPAEKQPVTRDKIEKQLGKLGDSSFFAETMEVSVSENAFIPIGAINELRRRAVEALENQRIEAFGFKLCRESELCCQEAGQEDDALYESRKTEYGITLSVHRQEQLKAVLEFCRLRTEDGECVRRVYLDCKLFEEDEKAALQMCADLPESWERILSLPYIIRKKDMVFFEKRIFPLLFCGNRSFHGVQVRNAEGLGILRENGYKGKIFTDAGFYIWNRATLKEWENSEVGRQDGFCLPLELSGAQQRELIPAQNSCEKIVYGRAPMMVTANCVANTTTGCLGGERRNEIVYLTDRYRKVFPVELNCRQCLNMIYNSVPLSLHGELDKWKNKVDLRLDFTVESEEETKAVLKYFTEIYGRTGKRSDAKPPYKEYTTGHEKRGVE